MTVGLRDVAALAGVSVGTVSNVLNSRSTVAPEYVDRVNRAVRELGFIRNEAARALKSGTSRTIGLVVPDGNNPFFTSLARGAEDEAILNGNVILVGTSHNESVRETRYIDLFGEQRARGVILAPTGDIFGRLAQIQANGTPTVLLDSRRSDNRFASVSVDDFVGGRIAAQHLIATGRRKISFVGGPPSLPQVADRLKGATDAVARTNGAVTIDVISIEQLTVAGGREVGQRILRTPESERPDALFAVNDLVALGILLAFAPYPHIVRHEISVIGYDDIDFASTAPVPLSSIRQPAELIGRTAVRIIESEHAKPTEEHTHIWIEPTLVERASTSR